jgi:DNA polymerase-3 subunit alpha
VTGVQTCALPIFDVLEQAQAAGQKTQQDAEIGQSSIFDLGGIDDSGSGRPAPSRAAGRPPISRIEFDQTELLAVEKEAIGLFISEHPLKRVRDALHAAVDCPLAGVIDRRDKDWVTVGGIITAAKKIRTRTGTEMMFATLDDLEGTVEILVFGGSLEKLEVNIAVDEIVLVRGRVDHKEGGTCVVAQSVDPFAPAPEEVERARAAAVEDAVPKPLRVQVDAQRLSDDAIVDLRDLLSTSPGKSEVVLELAGSQLCLGADFRVEPSPGLRAELEQLLGGPARLVA